MGNIGGLGYSYYSPEVQLFVLLILPAILLTSYAISRLFGAKSTFGQHAYIFSLPAAQAALLFVLGILAMLSILAIGMLSFFFAPIGQAIGAILFPLIAATYLIPPLLFIYWTTHAITAINNIPKTTALASLAIPLILISTVFIVWAPTQVTNVCTPCHPTTNMKNDLKNIVSSGYGITTPWKTVFPKDAYIDAPSVISDAPIQSNELQFICTDNTLCGGNNLPISIANNPSSITVNQNTQAYVVVCGNADAKQNPKYCIAMGRTDNDAKTACITACHMTG